MCSVVIMTLQTVRIVVLFVTLLVWYIHTFNSVVFFMIQCNVLLVTYNLLHNIAVHV